MARIPLGDGERIWKWHEDISEVGINSPNAEMVSIIVDAKAVKSGIDAFNATFNKKAKKALGTLLAYVAGLVAELVDESTPLKETLETLDDLTDRTIDEEKEMSAGNSGEYYDNETGDLVTGFLENYKRTEEDDNNGYQENTSDNPESTEDPGLSSVNSEDEEYIDSWR